MFIQINAVQYDRDSDILPNAITLAIYAEGYMAKAVCRL